VRIVTAAVVAVLVAVATTAAASAARDDDDSSPVLGPGLVTVDVGIEHSTFSLDRLRVAPGTTVRFVVSNRDPIDHELIVGDRAVHAAHERGGERDHPPVPGEVSVPPGARGLTFFEFDEAGEFVFACHLPGHVAFGMVGLVQVTPTAPA
jgi:uncharacterized cupredoxin-like copper-binding protein